MTRRRGLSEVKFLKLLVVKVCTDLWNLLLFLLVGIMMSLVNWVLPIRRQLMRGDSTVHLLANGRMLYRMKPVPL